MENVSTERPSWHMPFAGFSLFVVLLSAVFYTVVTHQGENASNMAWVVYGALMFYVFLHTFNVYSSCEHEKTQRIYLCNVDRYYSARVRIKQPHPACLVTHAPVLAYTYSHKRGDSCWGRFVDDNHSKKIAAYISNKKHPLGGVFFR